MVHLPLLPQRGFALLLLLLRAGEPLLLVACGLLAFWLRMGPVWPSVENLGLIALAAFSYTTLGQLLGCYKAERLHKALFALPRLMLVVLLTLALVVVVLFSLKVSAEFSRLWLGMWLVFSLVSLIALRFWAERLIRHKRKAGLWRRRVAVYGLSNKTLPLLEKLQLANHQGVILEGVYEENDAKLSPDFRHSGLYRGNMAILVRHGQAGHFDDVIVTSDITALPNAESLLNQLHALPVDVFYCLPLPFFGRIQQDVALLVGVPLVRLFHRPLPGVALEMKRAIDIFIAGTALVCVSPLLVALAAAVKLSSPGPVFFRQPRGGVNGSTFQMLKFRSMVVGAANQTDANGKEQQAQKHDQRITPVGRFIRRTSLDELPQLLNILRGDMSLVGPRPHAMSHNSYYADLVDRYTSRHKMLPGLTGWAQVNGLRGETETLEQMAQRVEYDIWYAENWSLGLDLKILFLTPLVLLFQKKAY
jgi:Undecaprenyl-phosphate glucose phosphotransferase